jgi:hypothetical protein
MLYGSGELRRAERLTDLVTAQLTGIGLGSCARDLCKADLELPVAPGEIALRGAVNVLLVQQLLRRRGFAPTGWSGAGQAREPIYSRPD